MAIAVAQAVGPAYSGGVGATVAQSITVSAGSTIVAFVTNDTGASSVATVSDTSNGSYGTEKASASSALSGQKLWAFCKENVNSGTYTVTASFSPSADGREIRLYEITGCATASFDVAVANNQETPGTGAGAVVSGTASNTKQPAGLLAFSLHSQDVGAPTAVTGTSVESTWDFGGGNQATASFQRVTTTGSQQATFTRVAGANSAHITIMVVLDETGATGGALPGAIENEPPAKGRALPNPRRAAVDAPVGTLMPIPPGQFRQWDAALQRPPLLTARRIDTAAPVGALLVASLTSMGWQQTSEAPRRSLPPSALRFTDGAEGATPQQAISAYQDFSVDPPPRMPIRPARAPESGVVGQRITAFTASSIGFLPSDAPIPRQVAPSRPDQPTHLHRLSFGGRAYQLSFEPPATAKLKTPIAESVTPIGAPFPFAPVAFQQWAGDAPRGVLPGQRQDSSSGPVGSLLSATAFVEWAPPAARAGGQASRPPQNTADPGARITGNAPATFQQWTVDAARQPLVPRRVADPDPVGTPLGFAPVAFQAWSVEARGPVVRSWRPPDPTELGARILQPPPLTFQTWSVEAGRLPLVPLRVSPPTELGPALGFAPVPFVAWSVETPNPRVPARRAPEPSELGPRVVTAPFQGWSVEAVNPRVAPARVPEPTDLGTRITGPAPAGFQQWSVEPRGRAVLPVRPAEPTTLPALAPPALSAWGWEPSTSPRAPQCTPARADTQAPLPALSAVLSSAGWMVAEGPPRSLPGRLRAASVDPVGQALPVLPTPFVAWSVESRGRPPAPRRVPDPTELGTLIPVVVLPGIGWLPSDATVSRFPRRPELNPDVFMGVSIGFDVVYVAPPAGYLSTVQDDDDDEGFMSRVRKA